MPYGISMTLATTATYKLYDILNQSYRIHITPLGTYSLLGRHIHTNMHTNFLDKSNFKKPGTLQPLAGAPGLKGQCDAYEAV